MKPLLLYDGDCGFCQRWINRWAKLTGDRVEYRPYQAERANYPMIKESDLEQAVHLVEEGGKVTKGAEAVLRAMAANPKLGLFLKLYERCGFFARTSEKLYKAVAQNRHRL